MSAAALAEELRAPTAVGAVWSQRGKEAAPGSITKVKEGEKSSHFFLFFFWNLIQIREVNLGTS